MKKNILIVILLLILPLTGCSRKGDINTLVLVSGIGIDKSEDGFTLIAQIVNPNILLPDAPKVAPVFTVKSEGKTVLECLAKMNEILPSKPFLLNFQIILIGEEFAKEGIKENLQFFINYFEARHEYNVALARGSTAETVLKQISVFSKYPTITNINKLKSSAKNYGFAKQTFIEEVFNELDSDNGALALSSIIIEGEQEEGTKLDQTETTSPKSKIIISDLGVFKNDKLIGWLTKNESIAYNFIKSKIEKTVIPISLDEKHYLSLEIKDVKTKIETKIVNNKPKILLHTSFSFSVMEDTSGKTLIDEKYMNDIIKKTEEKVKELILNCIKRSKEEFQHDIFGFSSKFEKFETKYWKYNKDNYKEDYKTMEIELTIKSNLLRIIS